MPDERTYTTNEICEMLGVSKSTLFRWEQEGYLPLISRDRVGQRLYTDVHVRAIVARQNDVFSENMGRHVRKSDDAGTVSIWAGAQEEMSLKKLLTGDVTGLFELAEYESLKLSTIKQLLKIALLNYAPDNAVFGEILRTALLQWSKDHKDLYSMSGEERC